MKKVLLVVLALGVLTTSGYCLFLQATPKAPEGPQTTGLPMTVARYYWPGIYWIEVADEKGWFKQAGLNLQLVDGNSDYFASLDQTAAGKITGNDFFLYDLMKKNLEGADLVAVVHTGLSFGAEAIVSKKEIETISNLRGKTVGVSKGTTGEYILSVVLQRHKLTLDDIVVVDLPTEQIAGEFIKGTLDAIVTWVPDVSKAIREGNGRKLFDTSEIPGMMPAVFAFKQGFIEQRPGDVQAYVNVWHKTTEFIKENPKEAFGIIADIYGVTPGEVQVFAQKDKIMDLRDNLTFFTYAAGFESLHGTARKINDFMIDQGLTDKRLDSIDFLDARFIHNLAREET